MRDRRRAPDGYLLVEALVALAIVAMMSGLVFDTVSQMSHSASVVAERRGAVLLARSVLAAATVDTAVQPIPSRGNDGPFDWSITTASFDPGQQGGVGLRQVSVTILDHDNGKQLARLSGLKVVH